MSREETKILEFNQYHVFDKASFIIYVDLESLIEKIDGCKNNPEKSSTAKVTEKIQSCFLMSTISSFKSIKSKHDVYRGIDCMKKVFESLRDHAMEIINFLKKKTELCVIFARKILKIKKYHKVRDHCHYTG